MWKLLNGAARTRAVPLAIVWWAPCRYDQLPVSALLDEVASLYSNRATCMTKHLVMGLGMAAQGKQTIACLHRGSERLTTGPLECMEYAALVGLGALQGSQTLPPNMQCSYSTVACAGEPVTIVALGGSITAGQGVTVPADGYIARFYAWVQARSPSSAVLIGLVLPAHGNCVVCRVKLPQGIRRACGRSPVPVRCCRPPSPTRATACSTRRCRGPLHPTYLPARCRCAVRELVSVS